MNPLNDLPALSVRRPLLALVINLLISLAGIAAFMAIEVRELPDVDRPIVSVRANYPGASPETMDNEVTRIVEGAAARVSGVRSIQSSSEEGNFRMRVEFSPAQDLDTAASDVREAVSRVARQLPPGVENLTVIKADQDAQSIMEISAVSDTLDRSSLTRMVEQDIIPAILSVPGVADVPLSGDRERQLRVVMDPLRLTSYGLSVSDVAAVLREAPFDVPTGSFRSRDQELLVRADASVVDPDQVEAIVIRGATRIGDVARVYFGPEDAESFVRLDGRSVVGLGVVRQAGSNTIRIADGVREAVERLNQRLDGLELHITTDDSAFIRGSVREVAISLSFTVLIVVTTIFIFLGSLRATLVPSVTIPIALIGTLAAIWLFGFSINILTLLALVLATGLVVDDAIVVLENIQRRRSEGLGARAAAVLGTRQVFFAVVATTAVLISVFVPIAFLPSTAGRLFREFGLVLAVAVAISSLVALSLVPAMGARLPDQQNGGRLRHALVSLGEHLAGLYRKSLHATLERPLVVLTLALVAAVGAGLLVQNLNQELQPAEDRGVIYVWGSGPDGVGLEYTERQANRMEAILQPLVESGEIASLYTVVGRWDLNRVFITAPLSPRDQRQLSAQDILAQIQPQLGRIPGVRARAWSPNSLGLRGSGGGLEVALLGPDYDRLYEVAREYARAIEDRLEQVTDPRLSYQPTQPQLSASIDRRRAADLGIPLDGLADTLRAMIDGDEIAELNVGDQSIPIILQASGATINDPTDLTNLYIRTEYNRLLPLSSVVSLTEEGVAAELDRHAQRRAIEVDVDVATGYPLQSAVDDLQRLADEILPPGFSMLLQGEAATLDETSQEVFMTYGIALLVVLLVLCAQFESIGSAVVVTLTVPFGVAAAIYALWLTGTTVNIYSQIGLVMLIGLMAKNGILIVEFADQLRDAGQSVREAIEESARVRLRPVAMTMISTVCGGLPLILSTGPGAEARHAIGWVVFGGLGLAAVFTLYLTPVVYLGIASLTQPRAAEAERLERELQEAKMA